MPARPDAANGPDDLSQLDGLLDEVRDLRLTLAADLATAAGAAELGETDIAGDILEGDRRELARFLRLADAQLRGERKRPPVPAEQRWRRRVVVALPAIPLVGAMTLTAAAAAGALTISGPAHHSTVRAASPHSALDSTFLQFKSVVTSDPSAAEVVAAANALHQQLSVLLQTASFDPNNADEVAQLLLAERQLLATHQVPGTPQVLAAASKLAAQLRNVAKSVATPTPTASPAVVASPSPKAKSTPSSSPSKSASSSPKATHSASPSASPSSSSSSDTGQIPHVGN
jgi:hypothetical protein